jgi:hypothetical protein
MAKVVRANAVVKMVLNVTTLLVIYYLVCYFIVSTKNSNVLYPFKVNAVVCPVGKEKIAPCRVQQILGASLALSDALASTMERVDRTTVSVDALMDGWDLNATRVN